MTNELSEYSQICLDRLNENESRNPDGSQLPFVRMSKDMEYVEIVVSGVGTVYRKKIGDRDPSVVETEVIHHAKEVYRFQNIN